MADKMGGMSVRKPQNLVFVVVAMYALNGNGKPPAFKKTNAWIMQIMTGKKT